MNEDVKHRNRDIGCKNMGLQELLQKSECYHHRTQSSPIPNSIERHYSVPDCRCDNWGSEETRRSYECLKDLKKRDRARCCRRRRCVSCAKLSDAFDTPTQMKEWWGMFVDLSDRDKDIGTAEHKMPWKDASKIGGQTK